MSRKTKSELSFLFKISLLFFILYASKLAKSGDILQENTTIMAEHNVDGLKGLVNSSLETAQN